MRFSREKVFLETKIGSCKCEHWPGGTICLHYLIPYFFKAGMQLANGFCSMNVIFSEEKFSIRSRGKRRYRPIYLPSTTFRHKVRFKSHSRRISIFILGTVLYHGKMRMEKCLQRIYERFLTLHHLFRTHPLFCSHPISDRQMIAFLPCVKSLH